MEPQKMQALRPLGHLEKYEAVRYKRGLYKNLATSASYFGPSSFKIEEFEPLIYHALGHVISQHPALSTVFLDAEDGKLEPYFARLPQIDLRDCVDFVTRTEHVADDSDEDKELDQLLEARHNTRFDERWGELPLWRLIILKGNNDSRYFGFTACFIYLHPIADGNSGTAFHRAFLSALSSASSRNRYESTGPIICCPDASMPSSIESVHPLSISNMYLVKTVWNQLIPSWNGNRIWTGNNVSLSAEQQPIHSRYRSFTLSTGTTQKLLNASRAHGTTLTGTCHALLCQAIFSHIPSDKTIIKSNISINMRRWLDPDTSGIDDNTIGNWVSNYYSDQHKEALTANFWDEAHRIKKALDGELERRGKDTVIGLLKHVGTNAAMHRLFTGRLGKPRERTFVLSNVGAFKTAIKDDGSGWKTGRMVFSQSFDPSGEVMQVMLVTGEDCRLSIGFVWGKGVVDDDLVPNIMETLKKSLVDAAEEHGK